MNGYFGNLLRINLSKRKITKMKIREEIFRNFLGGKGLGTYLLYKELTPNLDPFSPDNKLIIVSGPLVGTDVPLANRCVMFFKSPLTNVLGESYTGGYFPTAIKSAGYDAIIIEGKAQNPSYIWVEDDHAEIREAKHLWGKDTYETHDILKKELGDEIKIACIGPAGENLVKFSCIVNDYWRSASRGGPGAVMGSKNLKAIAVKGTKKTQVAHEEKLKACVKEIYEEIKNKPRAELREFGTPMQVEILNSLGVFPTRYWHKGHFEKFEKISGREMRNTIKVKNAACYRCPIACAQYCEVKDGDYAGVKIEGPEYETIYAFGGLCEIDDIKAIAKINDFCDRYGLDTITAGNVVAFAIEAYEQGKLKLDVPLKYGDPELVLKLLEHIVKKEGIGAILSKGVRELSKVLGMEDFAIHVKGLEPGGYDPRGLKGMALGFAVTSSGASHMRTTWFAQDIGGKPFDRFDVSKDKVKFLIDIENWVCVLDSMILCLFGRVYFPMKFLVEIYNAVTGAKIDEAYLQKIAERIIDLSRQFNIREGLTRKDDMLPRRFETESLQHGYSKGANLPQEELNSMLDHYYSLRGWDKEGKPVTEISRVMEKFKYC